MDLRKLMYFMDPEWLASLPEICENGGGKKA